MQDLEYRIRKTLARLHRTASDLGAWSLDGPMFNVMRDIAVDEYKCKLDQLDRLLSINNRDVTPRSEYLRLYKLKTQHRKKIASDRNRLKRDRKIERQSYKFYKEYTEGQDKRDRSKFGVIGWALLCVDNSSIATNLRRRLEPVISETGTITDAEIDRIFWVVGGSEIYKDAVKSRISHLIVSPASRDFTDYVIQWNACKNTAEKQVLLDLWDLNDVDLSTLRELAQQARRNKH